MGREDQKAGQLEAQQQEDSDDVEVIAFQPSKSNSVGVASTHSDPKDNFAWTETHPLVMHGDLTAEDLRKAYTVALNTVSTLLAVQTKKARETMVPLFCDRLHVRNWGSEGRDLQKTLRTLVRRVLPAVVSKRSVSPNSRASETTPNPSGSTRRAPAPGGIGAKGPQHSETLPMDVYRTESDL
jgi:hypothetical protein